MPHSVGTEKQAPRPSQAPRSGRAQASTRPAVAKKTSAAPSSQTRAQTQSRSWTKQLMHDIEAPARSAIEEALVRLGSEQHTREWIEKELRPRLLEALASKPAPQAPVPKGSSSSPSRSEAPSLDSLVPQGSGGLRKASSQEHSATRVSKPPPPPPQYQTPSTPPLEAAPRRSAPPPLPPSVGRSSERPSQAADQATSRSSDTATPPPSSARSDSQRQIPPVATKEKTDLLAPFARKFEALRYVEGASEAAEFLLDLALEVIPARAGLVHLHDAENAEFVIAAARGEKAAALESLTTSETDALATDAFAQGRPLQVTRPWNDPRIQKGRWALLPPKRAVVCAPAELMGRKWGFFELVDPKNGTGFSKEQLAALRDLAHKFAEFLATHA